MSPATFDTWSIVLLSGFYVEKIEPEDGPPFLRLTRADAAGIVEFEKQQR